MHYVECGHVKKRTGGQGFEVEIFGPERCLFASNFPLDRLQSSYVFLWHAFDQITASFSKPERRQLFHDNAIRYYRLR